MEVSELTRVFRGRSVVYNVFSKVFKDTATEETDRFFSNTFKHMLDFAENSENENMKTGAQMLCDFLGTESTILSKLEETRDTRAREYTRLFIMGEISISLYESVYTSPQRLTKQESWEQVKAFYTSHFFRRAKEDNTMEDHISLELQFVGLLSNKTADSIEEENDHNPEELISAQLKFLTNHIAKWVFLLCDKIAVLENKLDTKFYPAFALMLRGFLEDDIEFLKELTE